MAIKLVLDEPLAAGVYLLHPVQPPTSEVVPPTRTAVVQFVGVNTRGIVHYGDPHLFNGATRYYHQATQLDSAASMGARVVRCFLACETVSTTQTSIRLRRVLDMASERGLRFLVCFTDVYSSTPFHLAADRRMFGADGLLRAEWYQGAYREAYLPFVSEVVSELRDHDAVFAWELGNELRCLASKEAFAEFVHSVAAVIKYQDPRHWVSTGIINSGNLGFSYDQAVALYSDSNLDFLTVHLYPDVVNSPETMRAETEVAIAKAVSKPILIEEIGFRTPDRAAKTEAALQKWLVDKGCMGVMQWGFMSTDRDNGDGDRVFGLDPNLLPGHNDWNAIRQVYRKYG